MGGARKVRELGRHPVSRRESGERCPSSPGVHRVLDLQRLVGVEVIAETITADRIEDGLPVERADPFPRTRPRRERRLCARSSAARWIFDGAEPVPGPVETGDASTEATSKAGREQRAASGVISVTGALVDGEDPSFAGPAPGPSTMTPLCPRTTSTGSRTPWRRAATRGDAAPSLAIEWPPGRWRRSVPARASSSPSRRA